ncbi:ATP-binding protein, partial [Acidianus sp. RZ1]|uniref:ATP-binding protein n=1 Tax=Acidianus sp. RZ1 TaxID=1540082 RepID=UPI00149173F8
NRDKIGPAILFILGSLIILDQFFKVDLFVLVLFALPMILSIIVLYFFISKKKLSINIFLKNQIFRVNIGNQSIYGITCKIIGKQELDGTANLQKELDALLDAISRKEIDLEYVVITSISNKRKSSSLILFKKCENCEDDIMREFESVSIIAKAVSPHISLVPTPSSNLAIPIPQIFGNISYARVFDKVYDVPKSEDSTVDYDVEIGDITNGKMISSPIGIRSSDVVRHIGIFGSTGSGKSNTAALLSKKLAEIGFNVVILDWHGEFKNLLNDFIVFDRQNIIKINILSQSYGIEDIVDIIGDVLQLTDPQRFMLHLLLLKLKGRPFTLSTVIDTLNQLDEGSNWSREVKYALARKLLLLTSRQGKLVFSNEEDDIEKILESGKYIIDLSFLHNIRLRRLYGLFILKILTD